MSMNKILVIGNVGGDPEMRYTPSGAAVTSFSVATNRSYTTAAGEKREETQWFRANAWGRLAETCNTYITKGMKVYVEGRLSTSTWTGSDGMERTRLEIRVSEVEFLDRAGDRGDRADDFGQGPPPRAVAEPPAGPGGHQAGGASAASGPAQDMEDLPW